MGDNDDIGDDRMRTFFSQLTNILESCQLRRTCIDYDYISVTCIRLEHAQRTLDLLLADAGELLVGEDEETVSFLAGCVRTIHRDWLNKLNKQTISTYAHTKLSSRSTSPQL